jgi:Ethylbenzene dehydrogenase
MVRSKTSRFLSACYLAVCAVASWLVAAPAQAVDWNAVKGTDIVLFYPGQASWEWLLTSSDHSGAGKFKEGKKCTGCHQGEQKSIGNLLVSGKKLEPSPIKGKPGTLSATVKTAYDQENFYVRMEWAGAPSPSGKVMDADYAVKAAMMFDDGQVTEATRAGCFGVCHDDAASMASASADSKMTKYLAASRTKIQRSGGGENYKAEGDLERMLKDGLFMEYWQAKLNKGKPAVAAGGYLLAKREEHAAPLVKADAQFNQGKWILVLSRKLTPNMAGYKNLIPGKTYSVGFAIHDDHAIRRFHHVSFALTLALGKGSADLVAREIKP